MFDNEEITIDKVKDILYAVKSEFENEIDDIEDVFDKEISDESIDFAFELLERYIDKTEMVLNDELEDFPQEEDERVVGKILVKRVMGLEGSLYYDFEKSLENFIKDEKFLNDIDHYIIVNCLEPKEYIKKAREEK